MSHPDVKEAAVIGEPVGVNGEVPKALVIPSSPVSEETLVNFVNGKACVKEGFKVVWGNLTYQYMDGSSVVYHFFLFTNLANTSAINNAEDKNYIVFHCLYKKIAKHKMGKSYTCSSLHQLRPWNIN